MIAASLLLIAGAVTLLVMGLWQSSSALLGASIAASVLAAVVLIVGARRMPVGTAARARDPHRRDPGLPDSGLRDSGLRDSGLHDSGLRDPGGREPGRADHGGYDPGRRTDTEPLTVVPREAAGAGSGSADPTGPASAAAAMGTGAGGAGASGAVEPLRAAAHEAAAELRPTAHGGPAEHVTAAIPAQQRPGHGAGQGTRAPEVDEAAEDLDVDPPDEPAPQQVSAADAARVGRMLTEVLVVDGRPRYHLPGCVHLLGRDCEPLPVGEAIELGFTPCSLCEPDSALLADARRV